MHQRDLEYFLRIAETGSLRRAAQLLDVSQPAVTKGLRRLEQDIGLSLVDRSRNGAVLTEVGRAFLPAARRLHRDIELAVQEANDLRAGAQGLVRIGVTPALVEPILQDATMTLLAQRPAARFRIRMAYSDELVNALRQGEIDVMISGIPSPLPDDVLATPIGESVLGVIARRGHPLRARKALQLADFCPYPWMLPRRGVLSRDWLDAVFVSRSLPRPAARVEFDPTHEGLITMILESDMLTVGGEGLCRRLESTGLTLFDFEPLRWYRSVGALVRANVKPTPIVQRFLEILEARQD